LSLRDKGLSFRDIERDMPRWRVDFVGKVLSRLGTVEASDEKSAIAEAAKQFNITPARRNKDSLHHASRLRVT